MNGSDPQHAAHPEPPESLALPPEADWIVARTSDTLAEHLREVLALGVAVRQAFARRLGVSRHELDAMEHLVDEPIGPVELSRRLGITSAAATLLLHRLAEAGHVERHPHPHDRRRQVVVPTAAGLAAVFRELRPMVEGLDAVAAQLDDAGRAAVARYLEGVAEVLRRAVLPTAADDHEVEHLGVEHEGA